MSHTIFEFPRADGLTVELQLARANYIDARGFQVGRNPRCLRYSSRLTLFQKIELAAQRYSRSVERFGVGQLGLEEQPSR